MSTLNAEKFGRMCGLGWKCSVVLLNSTKLFQYVDLILNTGCLLTFWFPGFCYKVSFSSPHTYLSPPLSLSLPTHPFPYPPLWPPTPCHCLTLHSLICGQCIILCIYSITIDTVVVCIFCNLIFCNVMVGFLKPFILGSHYSGC